LEKYK